MFNFSSPFGQQIPADIEIIFVADAFAEDYTGGAELTTDALIEKSPVKYKKLHSHEVTYELIHLNSNKLWIFGNFANLYPTVGGFSVPTSNGCNIPPRSINSALIEAIRTLCYYVVIEYDYKFCRFRSPEKHEVLKNEPCNCHNEEQGKLISAFYASAQHIFWMSQKQLNVYTSRFDKDILRKNTVLSSVFDEKTLDIIRTLREKNSQREKWLVLQHPSWVKGEAEAVKWCKDNNIDYELVGNLQYEKLLEKFSAAKGFVLRPPGGDTCPRSVIEAKLLACELSINDNVQHADEPWFATDNIDAIEQYLRERPKCFWDIIERLR